MSLNLDDNKRPYSPNLGLNDVFDEIQASVNALETTVSNIPTGYTETIIELTPSDIRALGSTAVSLLPAPGVNKYYDIDKMIFEFIYSSGFAYTDMSGDYFEIRYTQSGEQLLGRIDGALISSSVSKVAVIKEFSSVPSDGVGGFLKVSTPFLLNEEIHLGTYNYSDLADNGQTATMRIKIYHKTNTIGA